MCGGAETAAAPQRGARGGAGAGADERKASAKPKLKL